jgi:nucleoside-diphosphate-sugar epimerase
LNNFDKCVGEIFNLGTDKAITTGEGIKIVEDIIGKNANFEITAKRSGDQTETHANIDKARRVLGYNPTTTPADGLKKEVDWFKENIWQKIDLYQ